MDSKIVSELHNLLDTLGLEESPIGVFYSDRPPAEAYAPKPGELPTKEKEMQGSIDWQGVFGNFS